jgi:hypothetical protein
MGCSSSKSAKKAVLKNESKEAPLEVAQLEKSLEVKKEESPVEAAAPAAINASPAKSPAKASSPRPGSETSPAAAAVSTSPGSPAQQHESEALDLDQPAEHEMNADGSEVSSDPDERSEATELPKKSAFGGLTFELDLDMPTLPSMPKVELDLCKGCQNYVSKLTSPRCNGKKSAMSEVDTALTRNHITSLLGQGLVTQQQHDQFLAQDQFYRDFSKHGYSPAKTAPTSPPMAPGSDRKIALAALEQSMGASAVKEVTANEVSP